MACAISHIRLVRQHAAESTNELRFKTWLLDSLNIVLHVNTYTFVVSPRFVATRCSSTIRESRFLAAILRCEMYYGDLE